LGRKNISSKTENGRSIQDGRQNFILVLVAILNLAVILNSVFLQQFFFELFLKNMQILLDFEVSEECERF
jgi:hypothetical protein